jgi:hypothetical protein
MGEAKRRKQLGLMPTVHPFEAAIDPDGGVTLRRGPDDADLRERILTALRETQPDGAGWPAAYRRAYVLAGLAEQPLETLADLEAIAVPPHRRLSGELIVGFDPARLKRSVTALREYAPLGEGAALRVRVRQHSHDGERWASLPESADPLDGLRHLMRHPLSREQGKLVATLRAEQWREGRIDFDAEPPEDLLEDLEALVREWHGETPDLWAQRHAETLELPEDGWEDAPVPVARRLTLELREEAPLGSPFAVAHLGGWEVHLDPERSAYSLDGESWLPYGDPDAAPLEDEAGEFGDLLTSMLDVDTVPVTVWADGRVEWNGDDVPAEQAGRVRADLRGATGAGDPDAWTAWTRALLTETFADEAPWLAERSRLPDVQAVRLDLLADALADPDDPAQPDPIEYFIESEVSFDGQVWRDLYGEEVPEELLHLRLEN